MPGRWTSCGHYLSDNPLIMPPNTDVSLLNEKMRDYPSLTQFTLLLAPAGISSPADAPKIPKTTT